MKNLEERKVRKNNFSLFLFKQKTRANTTQPSGEGREWMSLLKDEEETFKILKVKVKNL